MERFLADNQFTEGQKSLQVMAQKVESDAIPLVTVIVSLFNYKDYIIPCLESVKSQTLSNLDLIVVDDCSTDGSLEVAHDWLAENGSRFSHYLLIHHRFNKGLASSRNTGFAHARTEYVFVLDADNLLYPRCLERLVSALGNCDASFSYCYLEKFGDESCLQNTRPWNPAALVLGNTIDAMVLLRKSVWEQIGGYSSNDVMRLGWEDFELWFKIARSKRWGILVPEILARYRVHRSSMLNTTTNPNANKVWAYLCSNYGEFFSEGSGMNHSHGWKALLVYYKKKRLLARIAFRAILNPGHALRSINKTNLRRFIYYLKTAEPDVLEEKIDRNL